MTTPYPYQPVDLRAPAGTNPSTMHIWFIVILSGLICIPSFIYLGTFDFGSFINYSVVPDNPLDVYGMMFTPAYVATFLAGIIGYGLTAVLAFLDYRELAARGILKPFHWALSLIPSYGTYVYVIGRSVVVRNRTGSGLAPLWVFIGVTVLTFIIGIALTFVMMASMFASIEELTYY
jgi:hypothetical protein